MIVSRELITTSYDFYLILVSVCHAILLYLIVFHSPKSIQLFRLILVETSIFQLLNVVDGWFAQFSFVGQNDGFIEIRTYGPSRFYSPTFNFFVYVVSQTASVFASASIAVTFVFKYFSVTSLFTSRSKLLSIFCLMHIFSLLYIISIYKTYRMTFQWPRDEEYYMQLNANSTDTSFSIMCLLPMSSFPVLFSTLMAYFNLIYPIPLCWYVRRQIMAALNRNKFVFSAAKQADHKVFLTGLSVQVVVPLVSLPFTTGIYFVFVQHSMETHQFMTVAVNLAVAVTEPLVTLFSVTPYRRKLTLWRSRMKGNVSPAISIV